MAINDLKDAR